MLSISPFIKWNMSLADWHEIWPSRSYKDCKENQAGGVQESCKGNSLERYPEKYCREINHWIKKEEERHIILKIQ